MTGGQYLLRRETEAEGGVPILRGGSGGGVSSNTSSGIEQRCLGGSGETSDLLPTPGGGSYLSSFLPRGPYAPPVPVVVDAMIRHWVMLVAPTKPGAEGLGETIQELVAFFYADDGLVASPQIEERRQLLDSLPESLRSRLCWRHRHQPVTDHGVHHHIEECGGQRIALGYPTVSL